MKKYFLLLLTSATLGLTTSCSPFQVRSDYAETANFNTYKTYKLRIDDLKLNVIYDVKLSNVLVNGQLKEYSYWFKVDNK